MINYGADATQNVNFHYKMSLISSGFNKLFYNIFTKGIVPESGIITAVDDEGDESEQGTKIKIPKGLSFFISPNNRYATGVIQENFNILSTLEQSILEHQVLKCDIITDFCVTPTSSTTNWGYLVAEYNYLEFSNLEVNFNIIQTGVKPNDNRVVLGYVIPAGIYIESIDITNQDISALNDNIIYEMNVDRVNSYHAGNESGYIPISNGVMCSGLNTEMVNGYSGYQAAQKWESNSGLNAEYLVDEFGVFHQPGNSIQNIPISNKIENTGLNAELLGGSGYGTLSTADHVHYLDNISNGSIFRKSAAVNTNHHLTNDSFKNGAFTKEKIADECFFARNDDLGGPFVSVSGQITLTTNYYNVQFTPKHPTSLIFAYPPDIALQIVDIGGTYAAYDYIKIKAVDITRTHFTMEYTSYSGVDGGQYSGVTNKNLIVQYIAFGYGVDNTNSSFLSKSLAI